MMPVAGKFDGQALTYDAVTANGAWTPNTHLREVLDTLSPPPRTGLDLGCGTGQTISVVLAGFPHVAMTAVDESPEMLKLAGARFGTSVEFHRGDLTTWTTQSRSTYDLVTAVGILEFVEDLPAVLSRVITAMTGQGHLVFTFEPLITGLRGQADRRSVEAKRQSASGITIHRWEPGEIIDMLTAAGGRIARVTEFVAYRRGDDPVVYHLVHYTSSSD